MQLGFPRLALMTISCSYEPPTVPIWTVVLPNVGAVPPQGVSLHPALLFSG